MTPPEDHTPQDHTPEELRAGLNEIFGSKPKAEPAASGRPDQDPPDEAQWEQEELATLQNESPAVEQVTETATELVSEHLHEPQETTVPPPPAVADTPAPVTSASSEAAPIESAPAEAAPVTEAAPEATPAPAPVTSPVPPTPAPPVHSAPVHSTTSGMSNDLEEVVYASAAPAQTAEPKEGDEIDGYHLDEDLGRGWFSAHSLSDQRKQDVYVRPAPLWAGVAAHRLLPSTRQVGRLHVVEPMAGPPLSLPLASAQARAYVQDLARLLFALEKQGYAVTDIDPRSFLQTAAGLKLRFPPRLEKLGTAVTPTLRDGFTPPEVQAGKPADSRSGIYLLGAVLFEWLTGQPLPPEGPSAITLAGVDAPGMPQLLALTLAPEHKRVTPAELLEYLKVQAANEIPKYDIAAATNIGLNPERPLNEDSYGYIERQVEAHGASELFIRACVADGMGGMAAGEVASRAAVQGFLNSSKATLPEMVWDANASLLGALEGRDGGSTFSGVEIHGEAAQLGHVGDTRAYLRAGGEVTQISKDHSYVAAMVASGQMTPEEAQHSADRNKVLRSLGSLRVPQDNYVYTLPEPLRLKVGDRLLLVSDGVWGEVEPSTLTELLLHEPNLQHVVDRLLELALESGAPDNITALAIERVR